MLWRELALNPHTTQNPAKDVFLTTIVALLKHDIFIPQVENFFRSLKYKLSLKLAVLTTYSAKLLSVFSGKYSSNSYVCSRVQCISYLRTTPLFILKQAG